MTHINTLGYVVRTFGPVDTRSVNQLARCMAASGEESPLAVLCADHHPGYSMPIGGVLALKRSVLPAGVGYDIACGNCAVETPLLADDVDVARVMDEIWNTISFGVGRRNTERIPDHPVFDAIAHSPVTAQRGLLDLACAQLGTVGSGNHYVDLFRDRVTDRLWVGVHFGSRGFGHKTASGFLSIAAGKTFQDFTPDGEMDAAPLVLSLDQPSGQDYLAAMHVAGAYAYAGRDWVVDRIVMGILQTLPLQRVHNHHNYAWNEQHFGEDFLVIRKGATPARPGQRGFIGATMVDDAVIVEGVESPASADALYSTVHGAGRVMGRRQAAGKWKKGVCVTPGLVDWSTARCVVADQGVELRGAGADEAPECYKRLSDVLTYHEGTIRILHRLQPIGVAMAGAETFDPYKD